AQPGQALASDSGGRREVEIASGRSWIGRSEHGADAGDASGTGLDRATRRPGRDSSDGEHRERRGAHRFLQRENSAPALAGRIPDRTEEGEIGAVPMRGGDLVRRVATDADQSTRAEQRAGLRDGKAARGKVYAIRPGGARHVDAIVDQEGRGGSPADGKQASSQVEERGGGKVLLAKLDRGDPRRQA